MAGLRLAVRALVLRDDRLLMVNAWPDDQSDLICAPGGGVEVGQSLPDNLIREVREETGLGIEVGRAVLLNEFHDPDRAFHQVDVYFRCHLVSGDPFRPWTDPEGVVTKRYWLSRDDLMGHRFKPDSLPEVAWAGEDAPVAYDPLELILR
ncbi:MAG: NUDIX domain-containing protein [Silicimonas sp.]|nr:NUDIX domain-containing protein [Silicimonas sp.]